MMIWSEALKVVPVTIHMPLAEAPRALSAELIVKTAMADGDRVRLITPAPEQPGPEGDEPLVKPRTTPTRRPQHR